MCSEIGFTSLRHRDMRFFHYTVVIFLQYHVAGVEAIKADASFCIGV